MRKLSTEKRAMILQALVEGASIASTSRMTGASKITVLRLLFDAGSFCFDFHNETVKNLKTERVEADEIWSFCGCKEKTRLAGGLGHGDAWTWVAMDSDSKLVISYRTADRRKWSAKIFMEDLASRVAGRIQLTTDGYAVYPNAVRNAFGTNIDYAQLVKVYRADAEGAHRYSPPECIGCTKEIVQGDPEPELISTSYVERQNLTLRMGSKRFARLTLGFSKRIENHIAAINLHYWYYNFARKHQTLKTTPAVAAGLVDKPMTMLDLVQMIEKQELTTGARITNYLPATVQDRE